MQELTRKDRLVMVHLETKPLKKGDRLKEIPDDALDDSFERLVEMGYAIEDNETFHLTYDGEQYIQHQGDRMEDEYDKYFEAHA